MARTVRNRTLDNRSKRDDLRRAVKPYWHSLVPAKLHIGYCKRPRQSEGQWFVRRYLYPKPERGSPYVRAKLGAADDVRDADGRAVLNWEQATQRARDWLDEFERREREGDDHREPVTVGAVLADYIEYVRAEKKTAADAERRAEALIPKEMRDIPVSDLTTTRITKWLYRLAEQGARLRTRRGEKQKFAPVPETEEAKRARRATANRTWTILRAALNRAFKHGRVPDDKKWRRVEPFKNVSAARPGHLTVDEARRLVNASDPASGFRTLTQAALLTGCRYGELAALDVRDFNRHTGKLAIRQSKSAKARDVTLADEGIAFFEGLCAGRDPNDVMLIKHDWQDRRQRAIAMEFWRRVRAEHARLRQEAEQAGTRPPGEKTVAERMGDVRQKIANEIKDDRRWHKSEQDPPMREACKNAGIKPAVGFHQLRHTWASLAVMNGMPLLVVARNLGHSDTRMVEKHYGHLAASFLDKTIRDHAPTFGLMEARNVVAFTGKGER